VRFTNQPFRVLDTGSATGTGLGVLLKGGRVDRAKRAETIPFREIFGIGRATRGVEMHVKYAKAGRSGPQWIFWSLT